MKAAEIYAARIDAVNEQRVRLHWLFEQLLR